MPKYRGSGSGFSKVGRIVRRCWRFHNSWRLGKRGRTTGCGDLSGVNGTPLLLGIEVTHAPAQEGKRMAGRGVERQGERMPNWSKRAADLGSSCADNC